MCHWSRLVTMAFLCMIVYSNLPLSSALFGWLQGKKKVTSHGAQMDQDAWDAEKAPEKMSHSSATNRGPEGCGHKLKVALTVAKAYGASFKHWHWPWRKKKKSDKNDSKMNGGRRTKRGNLEEHLRVIDHCAAIAELEEYQRAHLGHPQRRRRQRRGIRQSRGPMRKMDDKSALRTLKRLLKRKNGAPLFASDHMANIGVIRWGRRTIRDIRRQRPTHVAPFPTKAFRRRQKVKNGKNGRQKGGRRRMKRRDDEEEKDEHYESSSDEEEDGNGTKFKYTKMAHGYSSDKNAVGNAKDKIYETVSFEAEHPHKGRYTQRTMTEYKFHGPKHSEWRHRPPKPPKASEGRAWTGKFKSRSRRGDNRRSGHHRRRAGERKSRHGRRTRKLNLGDYGDALYYSSTMAPHPMLFPSSSYGRFFAHGGGPWWYNTYSENFYVNGGTIGGFGYGDGGHAMEEDGFMPSGSLGMALKMVGIVLFILLLIIII